MHFQCSVGAQFVTCEFPIPGLNSLTCNALYTMSKAEIKYDAVIIQTLSCCTLVVDKSSDLKNGLESFQLIKG